jgi:hypothetical protein
LLAVLLWKRFAPGVRAFLAATLILLAAYITFYAPYDSWAGDFAWGDRYISSTVELTTLLAIPLLLRYRRALRPIVLYSALTTVAFSVIVQWASLTFWLPLEIYQMETFGPHKWIVLLRFRNITAFALGQRSAWGLDTPAIHRDPWDAAHLTAWNVLPSLLNHFGTAPPWAVHVLYGVWFAVALALIGASAKLIRTLLHMVENKYPD